jgi:hypothetical protein
MKRLKQEVIDSLLKNEELQQEVSKAMDVKPSAIYQSLKLSRGRSIAKSYTGMTLLIERFNLTFNELTEELDSE